MPLDAWRRPQRSAVEGDGAALRIAVIGGGISGLSTALALHGHARVTLFEAEPRLGGHARTVIAGRRGDQPVDTGFIVFNHATYPHLGWLFRELDVPVVALSQLSRSVESRTVKKPMLSDLRESGAIEQDADIVMFLYREDYYDRECQNPNDADAIILKNRHGELKTIPLMWLPEYTSYVNAETRREDEEY